MRRAQLIGLAVIVVASGLWATPAAGQELRNDGNELLQNCEYLISQNVESDMAFYGAARCTGIVRGVWLATQLASTHMGGNLCAPDEGTTGQMARVVVKYLKDHPEELHMDEVVLISQALLDAFPCSP